SPYDEKLRFNALRNWEDRQAVRIDYDFAVATKLVSVVQFRRSMPNFRFDEYFSPGKDKPINVSSYQAALYCNWLSEQEKIPNDQWCYEPIAEGDYARGMKVKPNYLTLAGYRLPRDAEWEYACRAGTATAWSHGSDEAMLGNYAWFLLNSNLTMQPV